MKAKWLKTVFAGSTMLVAAGALGTAALPAHAETLVIAAVLTPEGFDGDINQPGTQKAVVQVYEGITRYGRTTDSEGRVILDSSKIEGHLAESWTVSPDGKKVVFKLREGVKSPFGNEMTADDWVWSWDKSFKQKRTGNFIARVSNVVPNGVKALDKYHVEFTLEGPSAIFLKAITLYTPSIYDTTETKKHATADDPFAEKFIENNTASFGPYHLTELRPGEQAVYTANPNYFGKKPYFDRVIYRAVPSGASRVTLLRSGRVHLVENMTPQQIAELKKDSNVKVLFSKGRGIAAARMNEKIAPFNDVRVRHAFNYATNKQGIIDTVFLGQGAPAVSLVPPFIDGALAGPTPYPYNPEKARQLLAEAGYPNGLDIDLNYTDLNEYEERLAIQLQSQLKVSGIRVTPRRITASEMRKRVHINVMDLPFFTYEDGPIVLDSVYTMYLIARSTGVSNRTNYNNPKVDALIDEARVSLDRDKRLRLMAEAQNTWIKDAPWIFTTFSPIAEAMSPKLKGFVAYPDDHERWVDLFLEK